MPFTPEQRAVFSYFNGKEMVMGDPLAIDLALREAAGGKFESILKMYNELSKNPTDEYVPYMRQLIEIARSGFGIVFDDKTGSGTAQHAWDALKLFLEWSEKNVLSAANSPTGSRPSPSTPNPVPSRPLNTSK